MSNKTTNMWCINAQNSPNHPLQCSTCLLTLKYFSSADWKHLLLTCRSFCRILPSEEDSWYYSDNLTRPTDNPMTGTLINSLSPIQLLSFIFPNFGLMGGLGTMYPQLCTTLLAHRDIIQEKESVRRRKNIQKAAFSQKRLSHLKASLDWKPLWYSA